MLASKLEDGAPVRVTIDYYDLWYLLNNMDLSNVDLLDITLRKAAHKEVQLKSPDDFFLPALQVIARREWDKQLRIFVPTAPEADIVLQETRLLVERLWK